MLLYLFGLFENILYVTVLILFPDHNRYAVFCLLKVGTEIYDTELQMNIDRTACDVTFDEVFSL